jgi:integrase
VASIGYRDCKAFVGELLGAGLAPGTVAEARKVLRLVLAEALRSDAIRRNPVVDVRVPRGERQEMVFLTPDEVMALASEVARQSAQSRMLQYELLVRLAAFTGMRAGEVCALRVGRVNLLHGRIEIAESVQEIGGHLVFGPPKTYARRSVPVPMSLADELASWLCARSADVGDFVFTSPRGESLRHGNFYRRWFKPAVLRVGLDPRTRVHDLRHTAVALMVAEGAHLLAIKERLGHSTILVTADRYGHLFPSIEEALTVRLDSTYRHAVGRLDRRRGAPG